MIPLFRPILPPPESWLEDWADSRISGQLTNFGPCHERAVSTLERRFGGNWLPVTNGTVAIEVAVRRLPGWVRRVAVPDFTFAATIQAVKNAGREPVIVACCGETLGFDMRALRMAREHFDGILAVAPFGFNPFMEEIHAFADMEGKPVVWDLAGAFPMQRHPSAFAACYSLHAAKSLPVGEGGLVEFQREEDRDLARQQICFGFDADKVVQLEGGTNGKLDDLRAAILLSQLRRIESVGARIQSISKRIDQYQTALKGWVQQDRQHSTGFPSVAVLKGVQDAGNFVLHMREKGVVARRYYHPRLSRHPAFRSVPFFGVSDPILDQCVALPCDVSDEEFHFVVDAALSFFGPQESHNCGAW